MSKRRWGKIILLILAAALILTAVSFAAYQAGKNNSQEPEETVLIPERFGQRTWVVSCGSLTEHPSYPLLTAPDLVVEEIRQGEGILAAASFYARTEGTSVYRGMDSLNGAVYGIGTDFLEAAGLMVEKGRGITEEDLNEGAPAAVLNSRAASQVFSEEEALGKVLEIEGRPFQVVGIVGTGEEDVKEAFVLVPETIWPLLYQYEEPKSVVIRTETEERSAADYAARVLNSILPQNSPSLYTVQ